MARTKAREDWYPGRDSRRVTAARLERWSKLAAAHLKDVRTIDLQARRLVMFLDEELHRRP